MSWATAWASGSAEIRNVTSVVCAVDRQKMRETSSPVLTGSPKFRIRYYISFSERTDNVFPTPNLSLRIIYEDDFVDVTALAIAPR